jgi:hypothetical protein
MEREEDLHPLRHPLFVPGDVELWAWVLHKEGRGFRDFSSRQ